MNMLLSSDFSAAITAQCPADQISVSSEKKIKWEKLYSEVELYKASVRLYTTPLFNWRKALSKSSDNQNLYDFARHGLANLDALHKRLRSKQFNFRPGLQLNYNFNGRLRSVYIFPWEERLTDLLLYRILNRNLDGQFSENSYAYRLNGLGVDSCQRKIAQSLKASEKPLFIVKRDIADYFNSIDHQIILKQMSSLIDENDYLYALLKERIEFRFIKENHIFKASRGIPFGSAVACIFANIYLNDLDHALSSLPGLKYFRYSDDILFFSPEKEVTLTALKKFNQWLSELNLTDKESHRKDLIFSLKKAEEPQFIFSDRIKHLGLEFRANGTTGLSRDKFRKICNIFRYALRRKEGKIKRIKNIEKRTEFVIETIKDAMNHGIRNVAIIDYYLKHVNDEDQIRLIDRWLGEETLSRIFGNGHKKGNFKKISFKTLRKKGLPSLLHRRRLFHHGHLNSTFFIWKNYKYDKAYKGTTARHPVRSENSGASVFSPFPKAATEKSL